MLGDEDEYEYACVCLNKALEIRIVACGGREAADEDASLGRAWYLHGSAMLRRAQAMAVRSVAASAGDTSAGGGSSSSSNAAAPPPEAAAAAEAAVASLADEWQREGSGVLGRRVRRFFALHGSSDGTVIAWQPEEGDDEALYRVAMDDGDVEDLDEPELEDALEAHREQRSVPQEVELLLEAAWEALEMAVSLYSKPPAQPLGLSEAHERLGDVALQNEQPERALEEYGEARRLLMSLKDAGEIQADDRRLADIEWFLGVTHLQLGHAQEAMAHYRKAMATLRLRRAGLQRAALDRQIEGLAQEAEGSGAAGGSGGGGAEGGAEGGVEEEVEQIGEILEEIEARLREVEQAIGQPQQ